MSHYVCAQFVHTRTHTHTHTHTHTQVDGSSYDDEAFEGLDPFDVVADEDDQVSPGHDSPTRGCVIATLLDWLTKHKATDGAAQDAWDFAKSLLPPEMNKMGLYPDRHVKKIVQAHLDDALERLVHSPLSVFCIHKSCTNVHTQLTFKYTQIVYTCICTHT